MNPPKRIDHSKDIKGLYEIQLGSFKDERGQNFEIFNYMGDWEGDNSLGLNLDFSGSLLSCSISKKNVIRGMHGQRMGYKLIQILAGEVQFFVVDYNPDNETWLNSKEFILSADKPTQILLPPYSLNGHLCLSENCSFFYIWQQGYVKIENQLHGKWNEFGLPWQIPNPILSDRDK